MKIKYKENTKSRLQKIYEDACLSSKSEYPTAKQISEKFGLSLYGASCILYMFIAEEYCPELENIYLHDECSPLEGKDETSLYLIKFFEKLPPYNPDYTYSHTISEEDKKRYVSCGLAERVSFEKYRLERIHIYVSFERIIQQHNADMREALIHKDKEFYRSYFDEKDNKEEIAESLKRDKFNDTEIQEVFRLLSLK